MIPQNLLYIMGGTRLLGVKILEIQSQFSVLFLFFSQREIKSCLPELRAVSEVMA